MLGARDLAFPRLNLFSWYLFMTGGAITLWALFVGGVDTGWTFYTPLSDRLFAEPRGACRHRHFHLRLLIDRHGAELHREHPSAAGFPGPHLVSHAGCFCGPMYSLSVLLVLATPVLAITLLLVLLERLFHIGGVRSRRGRRSAALPAPFLVLFASGRVHDDPAGFRAW